jgi:hypothetical protein
MATDMDQQRVIHNSEITVSGNNTPITATKILNQNPNNKHNKQ